MGVLMILSVTAVAWRRYRQVVTNDYGVSLKNRLEALLAQTKQNLVEEQVLVVGVTAVFFIVGQFVGEGGFTNLAKPEVAVGLTIGGVFTVGLLYLIRRSYRQDIETLQKLLEQLANN